MEFYHQNIANISDLFINDLKWCYPSYPAIQTFAISRLISIFVTDDHNFSIFVRAAK